MKQFFIYSLLFVACQVSYGQKKNNYKKQNTMDSSVITTFTFTKDFYYIFNNGTSTTLTSEDLIQIDTCLKQYIEGYNAAQRVILQEKKKKYPQYQFNEAEDFFIDLKQYKRQYVAIINSKGEKEVWINCFCGHQHDKYWKESIIMVSDGGNCYFNLKINLTTHTCYDFIVNGQA